MNESRLRHDLSRPDSKNRYETYMQAYIDETNALYPRKEGDVVDDQFRHYLDMIKGGLSTEDRIVTLKEIISDIENPEMNSPKTRKKLESMTVDVKERLLSLLNQELTRLTEQLAGEKEEK